jgi:hypothetical protein
LFHDKSLANDDPYEPFLSWVLCLYSFFHCYCSGQVSLSFFFLSFLLNNFHLVHPV